MSKQERQQDILESGRAVTQETRLFDPDADETRSMRSKEVGLMTIAISLTLTSYQSLSTMKPSRRSG
jgi:hypothetical protein